MTGGNEWFISGLLRFFGGILGVGLLAFVIGYCLTGGVLAALGQ